MAESCHPCRSRIGLETRHFDDGFIVALVGIVRPPEVPHVREDPLVVTLPSSRSPLRLAAARRKSPPSTRAPCRAQSSAASLVGLDAPSVVAQNAKGQTFDGPVAADGTFALNVPADGTYRLFITDLRATGRQSTESVSCGPDARRGQLVPAGTTSDGPISVGGVIPLDGSGTTQDGNFAALTNPGGGAGGAGGGAGGPPDARSAMERRRARAAAAARRRRHERHGRLGHQRSGLEQHRCSEQLGRRRRCRRW